MRQKCEWLSLYRKRIRLFLKNGLMISSKAYLRGKIYFHLQENQDSEKNIILNINGIESNKRFNMIFRKLRLVKCVLSTWFSGDQTHLGNLTSYSTRTYNRAVCFVCWNLRRQSTPGLENQAVRGIRSIRSHLMACLFVMLWHRGDGRDCGGLRNKCVLSTWFSGDKTQLQEIIDYVSMD